MIDAAALTQRLSVCARPSRQSVASRLSAALSGGRQILGRGVSPRVGAASREVPCAGAGSHRAEECDRAAGVRCSTAMTRSSTRCTTRDAKPARTRACAALSSSGRSHARGAAGGDDRTARRRAPACRVRGWWVVFEQGDSGDRFYVVESRRADVIRHGLLVDIRSGWRTRRGCPARRHSSRGHRSCVRRRGPARSRT